MITIYSNMQVNEVIKERIQWGEPEWLNNTRDINNINDQSTFMYNCICNLITSTTVWQNHEGGQIMTARKIDA